MEPTFPYRKLIKLCTTSLRLNIVSYYLTQLSLFRETILTRSQPQNTIKTDWPPESRDERISLFGFLNTEYTSSPT